MKIFCNSNTVFPHCPVSTNFIVLLLTVSAYLVLFCSCAICINVLEQLMFNDFEMAIQ